MSYKPLLLLLVLTLFSCGKEYVELDLNGNSLMVEVAKTDQERETGLMNRDSLGEDKGMIFVFESEKRVSFWMKNTRIPLSIAYIGKDGTIYEIYDLQPYSLEPRPSKRSSILYALEVNQGYFDRVGITTGSKINLDNLKDYLKSSM